MAAQKFRVIFTQSAWNDLEEIVAYWTECDEPDRGEQYAHDLPSEAIRQLSDPGTALAGRYLRHTAHPQDTELPVFKRSYRILYLIKEADGAVEVLRFWHSHRETFQEMKEGGRDSGATEIEGHLDPSLAKTIGLTDAQFKRLESASKTLNSLMAKMVP
jgi:plasmid stabilization system protein ParE